jgi:hypothetical protein
MALIHEIASGVSNNDSTSRDKFRNTYAAIGRANEAEAASISGQQSAVALLKGICGELGVDVGSGGAAVNGNPNSLDDGLAAMGTQSDGPATDATSPWSAVSLAKGILTTAGFV